MLPFLDGNSGFPETRFVSVSQESDLLVSFSEDSVFFDMIYHSWKVQLVEQS